MNWKTKALLQKQLNSPKFKTFFELGHLVGQLKDNMCMKKQIVSRKAKLSNSFNQIFERFWCQLL